MFCSLKLSVFFASFRLKCVLATRDTCKIPQRLHHWNQHSISNPVIPHIAVYNMYGFVTKRINSLTVFIHVSDCVIGTGQTANTSRRKSTGDFSRHMQCKHKNNHTNAKKMFFFFSHLNSKRIHSESVEKLVTEIQ